MAVETYTFAALLLLSIVLFYGRLAQVINGFLAGAVIKSAPVFHSMTHFELMATLRLMFAGICQAAFFAIMLLILPFGLGALFAWPPYPLAVVYGLLLGVSEAMLIVFFSSVATRLLAIRNTGSADAVDRDTWQWISRAGWMRSFMNAFRILPMPLAALLVVLYVAFEEAVFRGLIITTLSPLGNVIAIPVSVAFFALAQTFSMPNWRSAAFPVMGAMIMGVIHGVLFAHVPDLLPLIIAHSVIFFVVTR